MRISYWSSDMCSSDLGELQRLALGQRVADVEITVVGKADDVARPGLLRQLAVARQEQHRVVHVDDLAAARMLQLGAALEVAGAQPEEGDAVAVEIGRVSCRERVCQYV